MEMSTSSTTLQTPEQTVPNTWPQALDKCLFKETVNQSVPVTHCQCASSWERAQEGTVLPLGNCVLLQ